MLDLTDISSGYGETQVLHGLSLKAEPGRVLAILGRNGAGGSVSFEGKKISGLTPFNIAKLGIAYVPETRDIFKSLTVRENLDLAARRFPCPQGGWTVDRAIELFPRLGERLQNGGDQLSGGEAQMLAIARGLLMNPRLLILDEPTEGLAPIIVKLIHDKLAELKHQGLSMVLVEQNFGFATSLADDVVVVSKGQVVWKGDAKAIRADTKAQHLWLGV
jgi:branched-chain amino acid transport system ATP-binding protein